jgi:hypothetical protein
LFLEIIASRAHPSASTQLLTAATDLQARLVPRFVERELRAYLACGILAHGFLRVRCEECGCERLVAYSCCACPACSAV